MAEEVKNPNSQPQSNPQPQKVQRPESKAATANVKRDPRRFPKKP